jgi:hypothetical protein
VSRTPHNSGVGIMPCAAAYLSNRSGEGHVAHGLVRPRDHARGCHQRRQREDIRGGASGGRATSADTCCACSMSPGSKAEATNQQRVTGRAQRRKRGEKANRRRHRHHKDNSPASASSESSPPFFSSTSAAEAPFPAPAPPEPIVRDTHKSNKKNTDESKTQPVRNKCGSRWAPEAVATGTQYAYHLWRTW